MNIFYLDPCPQRCAEMMHDKHVVKMILETAQILSTACHRHSAWIEGMYRPTHANHPSVRWAGDSLTNFHWLVEHGRALCDEYRYRYGKWHKSMTVIELCAAESSFFTELHWTEPAQAMPDEFKIPGDAVAAYRAYYLGRKVEQSKWTRRPVPQFVLEGSTIMAKKPNAAPVEAPVEVVEAPAASKSKHDRKLAVDGAFDGTTRIHWLIDENPRMAGRATYDRFQKYMNSETVKEYFDRGGTRGDLLWDLRSGYLALDGVTLAQRAEAPAPVAEGEKPRRGRKPKAAAPVAEATAAVEDEVVAETID